MRFAYQFKATGKVSQLSTIYMFITKFKSKQKQLKTAQEYNTGSLKLHSS